MSGRWIAERANKENAKECSRQIFQMEYSCKAYNAGVKQQVVDMAMNGSGTRDIGRVLAFQKTL